MNSSTDKGPADSHESTKRSVPGRELNQEELNTIVGGRGDDDDDDCDDFATVSVNKAFKDTG